MATASEPQTYIEEIATFLATRPEVDAILAFRPSQALQKRFRQLVDKNRRARLSEEEEDELDQMEQGELLLQLIKARLQPPEKQAS
jgi:hypothetical protein